MAFSAAFFYNKEEIPAYKLQTDKRKEHDKMRLNLDILAAWLPEQWRIKQFGSGLRELILARPRLYEPGVAIQADTLYLTRAEMLPAAPPEVSCSFVCIGRKLPKPYLTAGLPILQLPDMLSLAEVYNHVQEIYDKFDTWDNQLRDELEKDSDFDIQQFLLLGANLLHRGVNVVDRNLQRLFWADFDPQAGAYITGLRGPMSMEHNEKIKEVCTLERVIREPYQTALDFDGRAYCKNLYVSDQFCGCISINEFGRPFQPWEFPVMAHFFVCFQRAYFLYLRAFGRQENAALAALRKVLGGRALTDAEQQELTLGPQEAWLLFELREHKNERAFPLDYMYATLSAAFPQKVYAVIFHEKIVGLLRTSRSEPFVHQAIDEFSEAVFRMGYCVGLSNPFTLLHQAPDYLPQASYALAQTRDTGEKLAFFRDHVLSHMLDACLNELPVESLLTQGLHALIDHDRQKGSEYLHTLDLYLQNETSVSRTAEALFIHRSSLLKRLDKIYRLLGSMLDTPEQRLYLRLCLELLRRSDKKTV